MIGCSARRGGHEAIQTGLRVGTGVSMTIEIYDIEQKLEREAEEAQARMAKLVSQSPVNQYPSWVQIHKVNIIRNLSCYEEIREMLLRGIPTIEVARFIQVHGEMKFHKLDTVRQYLEHFKATIPKWHFKSYTLQKSLEAEVARQKQVNVLDEMAWLIQQQRQRIELGMNAERNFGFLQSGMERNMLAQNAMLKDYLETSQKLGGEDRSQKRSSIPAPEWSVAYDDPKNPVVKEDIASVMGNPESRTRVTRAIENILELTKKLSPEKLAMLGKNLVDEPMRAEIVPETVEGVEHEQSEPTGETGEEFHIEP